MALKKNQLYILFLAGIFLLVTAFPAKMPSKKAKADAGGAPVSEKSNKGFCGSDEEYVKNLEQRLKSALEHVKGVGKAEVMITLRSTGQKIVEKDYRSVKSERSEEDGSGGKRVESADEATKESVYVKEAGGKETPYISRETTPLISGVLIVCEGADSPEVAAAITEAVQALFAVEPHKIKIMKRTAR